jgi:ABC-type polysaccharide/polyol phosphate export permease
VPTITVDQRARLSGWRAYVADLWNRREFAWFLAVGNLRARNASTALGLFWWVLNPLIMGAVYFLVFGLLFDGRRGDPAFLAYLLAGLFVFNYTSTAMTSGANSVLQNSKLLVNVRFPRMILPVSALIEAAVGFLASVAVYYLIAWPVNGVRPTAWLLLLPPVFALHTVFNLGLSAATARLTIPFRDINNLLPHINRLWLYLSPIIWPLSFLDTQPEWFHRLLEVLNPLFGMLALYRAALMSRPFDATDVWLAIGWTAVIGVMGVVAFVRYEGNMVRHL